MSVITFVLCMEEKGISKSTNATFIVPGKMLDSDIKFTKNFLAQNMITEQPKVQKELDRCSRTGILTIALGPFRDIPEAIRKSVLVECITFLKPPGPRASNLLPQDYLIDETNYCSDNIKGCIESNRTGYGPNLRLINKVYFFIEVERLALVDRPDKRLEFAKLLNERLSSDSPANIIPLEILMKILGVEVQSGGGRFKSKKKFKKKSKKKSKRSKSKKRKTKRRKSKSRRRRRRSR